MIDEFDDFALLSVRSKGEHDADNVNFAVYINKNQGAQLNIKIGKTICDKLLFNFGDRIELRYSIGKRQILLQKGENGFKLRHDNSFRRNVNKGWHQEPFPAKHMSTICFDIVSIGEGKVIIQLPIENKHD